jgi:AraC-like DNA-binding protein
MLGSVYRQRPAPAAGGMLWRNVAGSGSIRVIPDGCLDLIWNDGSFLVAGPDTGPHLSDAPAGAVFLGVRFAPGGGPVVLGVPASDLRDQRVPLEALWPAAEVRRWADRMAAAPDHALALERLLARRWTGTGPVDRVIAAVARDLRSGASVAATADAAGLSERHLRRRCLAAFGYGPKTLTRTLRLSRAVRLARGGMAAATVAATAGYADQAHLAREVPALAGVRLTDLR